jgi:hypothetical protein
VTDAPNPPEPIQPTPDRIAAGAEPPPASGEDESAPAARRRERLIAIVLASVLGGLTVLCIGGLGTAFFVYRAASEPDRKTPAVVVEQFVEAMFNDRDSSRSHLFTCRDSDLGELNQVLSDLRAREAQFNTRFTVQTADVDVREGGGSATVDTDLQLSTSVSRSTQRWRFSLKNQSGWRVCGAHRVE